MVIIITLKLFLIFYISIRNVNVKSTVTYLPVCITLTVFFISCMLYAHNDTTSSITQEYTWQQISGNWAVVYDNRESYLKESRGKTYIFNYSPLINLNAIITSKEVNFTTLTHTFSINAPSDSPLYFTFFDCVDYRQFYAVQFTGDSTTIHTVSIIKSDIKDTTLPKQAKGNFIITTLATKPISLEYGKTYTLAISVQGNTISIAIDNAQVLSHTLDEELEGGKIGFASKNCIPVIDNLKVYKGNDIIFQDDFSKESIRKIVLQGKKLTPQEVEEYKKKNKK